MEDIKTSIEILLSSEKHRKRIDKFARKAFDEKFKERFNYIQTYYLYNGFEVVNKNTIRVKYEHGAFTANYSRHDTFDIKLK